MENRRSTRVSMMAELEYVVPESAQDITITKRITELSEGGLFVDTPVPAAVGTTIEIRFHVDGAPVVVRGHVAYAQAFIGMGVEFTEVPPLMRDRVRGYIASREPELALV